MVSSSIDLQSIWYDQEQDKSWRGWIEGHIEFLFLYTISSAMIPVFLACAVPKTVVFTCLQSLNTTYNLILSHNTCISCRAAFAIFATSPQPRCAMTRCTRTGKKKRYFYGQADCWQMWKVWSILRVEILFFGLSSCSPVLPPLVDVQCASITSQEKVSNFYNFPGKYQRFL